MALPDVYKEQKRGEGAEDVCKGMMMMGPEPRRGEDGNVAGWAVKRQQAQELSGAGQGGRAEIEAMGEVHCCRQQSGK